MSTMSKDAGQAQERPRPITSPAARDEQATEPARRSAGFAPHHDALTSEQQVEAPTRKPGMLANPWVQQFSRAEGSAELLESQAGAPASTRHEAGPAPEPSSSSERADTSGHDEPPSS